jgi:hypothetical protein
MDRRRFLKSLGLGAPALAFPLAKVVRGAHALPEKLPNIVLIMADDMGLGDPRCYNPESLIPTPQMDRISAEGTKFTDACRWAWNNVPIMGTKSVPPGD